MNSEIRWPIQTALNLMDLGGVSKAERELSVITRQVQHLTRLVDDLLDVSRITSGKVSLTKQPIELSQVVTRALEMTSPLFEQRDLHIDTAVNPQGLRVDADAARLTQAFANLLTNAAKYTDPGDRVSITAERVLDEVVMSVSDESEQTKTRSWRSPWKAQVTSRSPRPMVILRSAR